MIEVFTHIRISPDCPFKSNQKPANFWIWVCGVHFDYAVWSTCWAWLCGMMHTVELDSPEGCTPWSILRNLGHLTPRSDSHCGAWLYGMMHIAWSLTFVFSNSLRLSTTFYRKSRFHRNTWRHHREIIIIKFQIKTGTWQVTDSMVWCTLQSLTLRYDDAHRRVS